MPLAHCSRHLKRRGGPTVRTRKKHNGLREGVCTPLSLVPRYTVREQGVAGGMPALITSGTQLSCTLAPSGACRGGGMPGLRGVPYGRPPKFPLEGYAVNIIRARMPQAVQKSPLRPASHPADALFSRLREAPGRPTVNEHSRPET